MCVLKYRDIPPKIFHPVRYYDNSILVDDIAVLPFGEIRGAELVFRKKQNTARPYEPTEADSRLEKAESRQPSFHTAARNISRFPKQNAA